MTIEQVRDAFDAAGEPDAVVQTTSSDGEAGFLVRTADTSAESAAAVANQVADQFGWSHDSIEVTTIGPDWGAGVIQASVIALPGIVRADHRLHRRPLRIQDGRVRHHRPAA